MAYSAPYLDMPTCKGVSLTAAALNEGKEQSINGTVQGAKVTMVVGRGSPNGVRFMAIFNDNAEPIEVPEGMAGFEEGEITEGSLEISLCDVTGDGVPELLLASGDDVSLATAAVYVCTTQSAGNAPRWKHLGTLEGQNTFTLKDGRILVPVGSQGLFDTYLVRQDGLFKQE